MTLLVAARSSLYLLFLALTVIGYSIPLAILGWLLPSLTLGRIGQSWAGVNLWGLRWICGLDYRIDGLSRLPERNCIILAKHQSAWETIALRAILPPEQTWVLKRELLWIPFFGWALAPYRPIAIDRSAGRAAFRQLMARGAAWLAKGRWVILFPEGTRVAPGERRRYGLGGALLAERTGVPVVPIAHNAGVFWQRRAINKYPGTIEVVIGEPIATAGRSAQEINQQVEDWIERTVASLPQQH
ncbi:1-acyl-sn-glycerol-3-phosphate acyltransferase [Thioflavicoccus mobilis 8321]|uniref:1-acyl-sn-glycerol-3-phosphate acyltransferase n=1 Tax=Thioflavicoccus mobilis 8321 TaxID=765912 RepID=L0GZZ8_9GAMM|nr:lysophospholipid acyltransferase family protein [Thioflavicoccus mobilis]AGA92343.1 1-acyl-sn-glycerol-3-phosphate acyltransferase [Thioflavicoccus mobilis 8321]